MGPREEFVANKLQKGSLVRGPLLQADDLAEMGIADNVEWDIVR